MVIRKHYYVGGSVQGVGFRYRAYHLANSLRLTGYVRNLVDGRVELELQGEEALVHGFLARMEEGRFIQILDIRSKDMDVVDDERGFYID